MPSNVNAPRDANAAPTAIFAQQGATSFVAPGQIDQTTGRILVDVSGAGVTSLTVTSLSSQLNGSTKSFTIPANTGILGVFGSSAPFVFDPTTDYSGGGTTTITFGASVDAPSALATGQTLIVQTYV